VADGLHKHAMDVCRSVSERLAPFIQ